MGIVVVGKLAQPPGPGYMVVLVGLQRQIARMGGGGNKLAAGAAHSLARWIKPSDKSLQFLTKGNDWKGPVSLGLRCPGESKEVSCRTNCRRWSPTSCSKLPSNPTTVRHWIAPTGPGFCFIGRAVKII